MEKYSAPEDTWEYRARWNNLRDMGNSYVAKAAIAVPMLGYLILFHADILDYIKIHSSFCQDCSVSWRLHAFYFASCFIALGALLYAWRCPSLIKKYAGATDFYEAEKNYFCNPDNLNYLFGLIEKDKGDEARDPHNLQSHIGGGQPLHPTQLTALAGVMGEHYVYQNRNDVPIRIATLASYYTGFAILFGSAVITVLQIIARLVVS